jgi:NDP-sugar pyrophosphorylase family protein
MKALILSAGLGTRLRPLTNRVPKPMIKVAGKPVLEHIVEKLESLGIDQIIANTHYKPEVIYNYFGPRLLYSYEPQLLGEEGTVESLKRWFLNDYTVVMNGDTLTTLDILKMMEMSDGKSVMSVDGNIYTGCKILSPDYFRGNKRMSKYFDASVKWFDIGTFSGLMKAREYYEGGLI